MLFVSLMCLACVRILRKPHDADHPRCVRTIPVFADKHGWAFTRVLARHATQRWCESTSNQAGYQELFLHVEREHIRSLYAS